MIDIQSLCPGCMGTLLDPKKPCPRCGYGGKGQQPQEGDGRTLPVFTIVAGRYLLGRKLGAGGFGITYLAMDLREEIPVAVKEFFPAALACREGKEVVAKEGEQGDFARAMEGFRREASLLSRFSETEGIVCCRDYLEENRTAYLVMEYVEGENLKRILARREKPFSQQEALELMRPVLLAVEGMHRKNVLHRDISPENLILKPDGTLTLIDFGAAREYELGVAENRTVIIKRGYAPKEQYDSAGRQGPWTDLYACCAVLYQMVSGILPQDAASRSRKDELEPLETMEGIQVSESFAKAVAKGMSIDATSRFPSIKSLMEALYPEKKQEPKPVREVVSPPVREPVPERKREESPAKEPGKRRFRPVYALGALLAAALAAGGIWLAAGGVAGRDEGSGADSLAAVPQETRPVETQETKEGETESVRDTETGETAEETAGEEGGETQAPKEMPLVYGNVQQDGSTWINTRQLIWQGMEDPQTGELVWQQAMDLSSEYVFGEEEISVSTRDLGNSGIEETLWIYGADGKQLRMESASQRSEFRYEQDREICTVYDAQGNVAATETRSLEEGRVVACDYEASDPQIGAYTEHADVAYYEDGSYTETMTSRYESQDYYGVTTSYYGAEGRLEERRLELVFEDGSAERANYRYTYETNAAGQLTQKTETYTDTGGQSMSQITAYTYDEYGNQLTEYTYSDTSGYASFAAYLYTRFSPGEGGLYEAGDVISGSDAPALPAALPAGS